MEDAGYVLTKISARTTPEPYSPVHRKEQALKVGVHHVDMAEQGLLIEKLALYELRLFD